jgi:hypothetical protein
MGNIALPSCPPPSSMALAVVGYASVPFFQTISSVISNLKVSRRMDKTISVATVGQSKYGNIMNGKTTCLVREEKICNRCQPEHQNQPDKQENLTVRETYTQALPPPMNVILKPQGAVSVSRTRAGRTIERDSHPRIHPWQFRFRDLV